MNSLSPNRPQFPISLTVFLIKPFVNNKQTDTQIHRFIEIIYIDIL